MKIITWNARALCCVDVVKRRRKLAFLEELCRNANIIVLQEVHDTLETFAVLKRAIGKLFNVFHSSCPNISAGGVMVLMDKGFDTAFKSSFDILVPGRVVRLEMTNANGASIAVWNLHNFDISNCEFDIMKDKLEGDILMAKNDPARFSAIVAGDFNFTAQGEGRYFINRPGARGDIDHTVRARSGQWPGILEKMVEMKQQAPTHITVSSMSLMTLDRVYLVAPAWLIVLMNVRGPVTHSPQHLHQRGISDHAPVLINFAPYKPIPVDQRPIPHHVAKSKWFAEALKTLEESIDLDSLAVPVRWQEHKRLIRQAGKIARQNILLNEATSSFSSAQALTTASRVIANNDTETAAILIKNSELCRQHIYVCQSQVFLHDAVAFGADIEAAKNILLAGEREDISNRMARPNTSDKKMIRLKKQAALNARRSLLWAPVAKRRTLAGLRLNDAHGNTEHVTRGAEEMATGLAAAWAPTFARKNMDESIATSVISEFASDYSQCSIGVPSVVDFVNVAARAPNTKTGKDGIPYAARRGESAATTLALVFDYLASGLNMPVCYNDCVNISPPEGEETGDDVDLVRDPSNTRLLALKNADNKIIATVANSKIKATLTRRSNDLQRGFIAGRSFLRNVVELDTHARTLTNDRAPSDLPCLAFFDFAAAFASICHDWIFAVLEASGWPVGFVNVIKGNYT